MLRATKPVSFPSGQAMKLACGVILPRVQNCSRILAGTALTPTILLSRLVRGGTQGGLIAGKALFDLSAEIRAFNVCDDAAYFESKIRSDLNLWKQRYSMDINIADLVINTVEGYVGPGYAKADASVFATIKQLARTEALFLDPVYTAKAFHGMVNELRLAEVGKSSAMPNAREVVFIHTGGLFGIFPQKDGFAL